MYSKFKIVRLETKEGVIVNELESFNVLTSKIKCINLVDTQEEGDHCIMIFFDNLVIKGENVDYMYLYNYTWEQLKEECPELFK